MELELKHLAHYLPYGLKIMIHEDFEMELTYKRVQDSFEDDLEFISIEGVLEDYHCKPILRPLSDLTKEIEVNGEKFVPIKRIQKEFTDDFVFSDKNGLINFKSKNITYLVAVFGEVVEECPIGIYNKLLQWHFDVFGLIENNLAIDINTLNQ